MADKIGPTFKGELEAAGVSLDDLSWNLTDGTVVAFDGPDHLAAAEAVLARHDPTKALVVVPDHVSNYQARAVLIQQGLFAQVDAALRGADQAVVANHIALMAWDYANDFYRSSDIVTSMAGALGLTAAQIDGLFIAAAAVR